MMLKSLDRSTLLEADAIHVWRVPLDKWSELLDSPRLPLSADELDRARKFHFDRDRGRFIVCRTRLRQILAYYVGADPRDLRFRYGEHGKPELCDDFNPRAIRVNVAHSSDMALIGVTLRNSIGVDIELIRQIANADEIVCSFFSTSEAAEYERLTPRERSRGFFNGWTRKEAFLKAHGGGLSYPLSAFDITLTPGMTPRLLRVRGDSLAAGRWSMFALEPWPGFAAAVIVERSESRLHTWEFIEGGSSSSSDSWSLPPQIRTCGFPRL